MRFNGTVFGRSALLAAALAVGACEKQVREAKTEPTDQSKQVAVADASLAGDPTTAADHERAPRPKPAADTQPAVSMLMLDGVAVQFPPTKLLLASGDVTGDSPVSAELFSDLPKSALRKYAGNELYLEVKLDGGAGPQKVDGASWSFKAARSEKADSPNGIFLNGQSTHLQPIYAFLKLERKKDGQLVAQLAGQFRAFENGTPETLAPFVDVRGEMPVEIVQKR
jgi:hypothetical protein